MIPDPFAFDPATAGAILLGAAVAGALWDPLAGAYRAIRRRAWYALECPPTLRPRDILRGIRIVTARHARPCAGCGHPRCHPVAR